MRCLNDTNAKYKLFLKELYSIRDKFISSNLLEEERVLLNYINPKKIDIELSKKGLIFVKDKLAVLANAIPQTRYSILSYLFMYNERRPLFQEISRLIKKYDDLVILTTSEFIPGPVEIDFSQEVTTVTHLCDTPSPTTPSDSNSNNAPQPPQRTSPNFAISHTEVTLNQLIDEGGVSRVWAGFWQHLTNTQEVLSAVKENQEIIVNQQRETQEIQKAMFGLQKETMETAHELSQSFIASQ